MNNKRLTILLMLVLMIAALTPKAKAQPPQTKAFYYHSEAGLCVEVKGPEEAEPGDKINITITLNSTADDLKVNYVYLTVYDFKGGREKKPVANLTHVAPPGQTFNYDENLTKSYEISISQDAWDIMYGEISCEWVLGGTVPSKHAILAHGFVMTYVRNVEMEEMAEQLQNTTKAYEDLLKNYTELNQTYWDLKINGTSSIETELSNTRLAMVILVVTTVFFIATTLYLMVKKPREYW